jgi:plasmid stabilization system protein ParE
VKVLWTEQAWTRLAEIEAFIARDNPAAASKFVDKLVERGGERRRRYSGIASRCMGS